MNRTGHYRTSGGFSLLEVLIATATIGIGISALMVAVTSSTKVNGEGRRITQAVFLAQELREWTIKLPFSDTDEGDADKPPGPDGTDPQVYVDDLDDLMGVTYSPPRDGQGMPIFDMTGWSQTLTLTWRDPDNLATAVAAGDSNVINVQVTVAFKGAEKLTTSWLVTRRD